MHTHLGGHCQLHMPVCRATLVQGITCAGPVVAPVELENCGKRAINV